jgi:DNA invertase Pin-like site-specific DNA recombinase
MKRGVSYGRVSTGRQAEEGTSVEAQHAANQKRATEMDVDIIKEISDDISGELYLSRPGIQEVIQMAENKHIEYVFFHKLDRSSRNTEASLNMRKRFKKAGVTVVYSSGQQFSNDPTGNLGHVMFAGFAEFEKEMIKERTVRGSRARVTEQGRMVSPRSPYGYHVVNSADIIRGTYPEEMKGKYFLVEETSDIAQWIFFRYDEGDSLNQITERLNKWLVPSPTGVLWSRSGVSAILANPVYKGMPAYGKRRNVTDEQRCIDGRQVVYTEHVPEEEWLYMEAPALVGEDLWDRVQTRKESNKTLKNGDPSRRYMLSGILWCPLCSGRMRGIETQGTGRKYYICTAYSYNTKNCAWSTHLPAPLVDACVVEGLNQYVDNREYFDRAVEAYKQSHKKAVAKLGQMTEVVYCEKIAKLDQREKYLVMEKIEERSKDGDVTLYIEMIEKVRTERQDLISLWKDMKPTALLDIKTILSQDAQFQAIIENSRYILTDPEVDNVTKKTVIQKLIHSIKPDKDGILEVRFANHACAWLTEHGAISRMEFPD